MLAKEGVELDIKVFSDYVQPNLQLADKELDANFFQHKPYLDTFNKDRGTHLVSVGLVHVEPFGGYSRKVKSVADLPSGATVAIPNDPSNSRSEEHTSELQSLMRNSYDVFCLKKKTTRPSRSLTSN